MGVQTSTKNNFKKKIITLLTITITLFSCSTFKEGSYTVKTSRYRCGKSIVTFKEIGGEWVIDGRIKKQTTITIFSK